MPTPQPQKQTTQPRGATVGPLRTLELYGGGKKRKEYLPWSHAEQRLVRSRNYWICTARPDGRPHSIPVSGMWVEGALYFGTARSTCKARNLVQNPAVSVHLESGDDVVIIEGQAAEVSDPGTFKKLDAASKDKYKMPLVLMPESVIYRVRPRVVLAWLEKDMPGTGTRWEFREN
jgi:hypothetical protein